MSDGVIGVDIGSRPADESPTLAAQEVAVAFLTHSRPLDPHERAHLLRRGISDEAIDRDPYKQSGEVRLAGAVFSDGYFEFAEGEDQETFVAFVVVARDLRGDTSDIIAFSDRGSIARWLKRTAVLGEQMILASRLCEPLQVFPDVWAWLRGGRDGVVVLDWGRAASALEGIKLEAGSIDFGSILRKRLARPAPPIVIRGNAVAAVTDHEFIPPDYEPPGEPIEAATAVEFRTAAAFCAEYVPISHVVEPFIRSSSLYTLTARTGAGKTALLIIMALAVATGRGKELLGREVESGRVAVTVAENPDGFRMRLMVAAFLYNIALSEIANDLLILDKRMKPEAIAAALNRLSDDGPVSLIILDTLQALFDGDDLNHNVQAGDFMRRWRPLTQIRGKPAVVIAAHPVKNAAADNLIPYGGGAILNEVDGNLTLSLVPGGVTEMHWQGKLRGIEFEPVKFRFEALTSPDVKDVKGREVRLPVLRPMTEADAEQREKAEVEKTAALIRAMATDPTGSLASWATTTGIHRSSVERTVKRLARVDEGKLTKKVAGKWALTKTGLDATKEGV